MDGLWELLAQPTPLGVTVGQIASVFVVAAVLLIGLVIVRVVLRLGSLIFRLGCAAIIIFACGLISFMMLTNGSLTNGH